MMQEIKNGRLRKINKNLVHECDRWRRISKNLVHECDRCRKINKNIGHGCDRWRIPKAIQERHAEMLVYFRIDLMLRLELLKNVSILESTETVKALKQACEIFQGKKVFILDSSVFVFIHSPKTLECFKDNIAPFKERVQTKDLLNLNYESQPFMLCSEVTNQLHVTRKSHSTDAFFSAVEKEIKENLQTESYRVVYREDLLFDLQTETQTKSKIREDLKSVHSKSNWNLKPLPSTLKQEQNYKYRRHRKQKVLPSREIKSTLQVSPQILQDSPLLQYSPVLQDSPVSQDSLLCYPLSGMFHSKPLIPPEEVSFSTQVSDQTETGRDEVVFSSGRSMDVYHVMQSQLRHTAQQSGYHPTDQTPSTHVEPRGLYLRPPIPPRYPFYKEKYQREKTFKKWENRYPDPATLCNAGFFFTNEEDLVRCYQCGIGLKYFSFGDDPLKEHVRHSRDCFFLKEHIEERRLEQIKAEINEEDNTGSTHASGNGPKYRHPEYMSYKARLSSFSRWPQALMQTPHQLASAGFFYTGFQDNVRCFACDGGLRQWDPDDDPWTEHCLWFPDCPYVKEQKGEEYVKLVQTTAAAEGARGQQTAELVPPHNSHSGPDISAEIERLTLNDPELNAVIAEHRETCQEMGYSEKHFEEAAFSLAKRGKVRPTIEEILDAIEAVQKAELEKARQDTAAETPIEENMRLKSMINCMTCGVKNVNALFLPCTHHRLCMDCAKPLTWCPVCNERIRQKIRTYMA